ncbi:MAG: GYD domain-containing protein [candidate division Zixibacteria bacterium]|nr:GYD domain-containing protein [candidate division Zixibacteria bacterium]
MPIYVTLFKSTAEGTKGLKESQRYIEEGQKEIREAGGKIINAYALLGRYDFLYITEFPDQKSALKVLFKTAMKGRIAPENLVAIPLEEFLQAVKEA